MKKTWVVTGGAGFIGSHLGERLLSRGHCVMGVDNLITGSLRNVEIFRNNPRFHFLRQDVSKKLKVSGRVHGVLHFASPASPPDYLKFPLETLKVGSFGTFHALELARTKRALFMLASTSEVYGDPEVNPQSEQYWGHVNPIGPRSVYDEAKRFSESLTMAYRRSYRLNTKIIRIFNTYGPRMRPQDGRVIPNFLSQALRKEPLTLYGDGRQTRSYCYIDDLMDGIEKYLSVAYPGPINLGNPNGESVRELALRILNLTGSKSALVRRALPVDDPKQRCPDISRARKILGWRPRVPLDEGLRRTLEYFRNEIRCR